MKNYWLELKKQREEVTNKNWYMHISDKIDFTINVPPITYPAIDYPVWIGDKVEFTLQDIADCQQSHVDVPTVPEIPNIKIVCNLPEKIEIMLPPIVFGCLDVSQSMQEPGLIWFGEGIPPSGYYLPDQNQSNYTYISLP